MDLLVHYDKISPMVNKIKSVHERVRALILNPAAQWQAIKSENTTIEDLFKKYAVFLAVIPAISIFIGSSIIGDEIPLMGAEKVPMVDGLIAAVLCFGFGLLAVYVVGLAINYFAHYFEAKANPIQAMKVAVYCATPFWVSSIFFIYPPLSFLAIVRWYSVYMGYSALTTLMETPKDKVASYLTLVTICALVAMLIVDSFVGRFLMHRLLIGG